MQGMKERYHISGMTCSACSSHVEKAVNKLKGVEKASVNLLTETMEVMYEEEVIEGDSIVAAVEKAGYGAALIIGGVGKQGAAGGTSRISEKAKRSAMASEKGAKITSTGQISGAESAGTDMTSGQGECEGKCLGGIDTKERRDDRKTNGSSAGRDGLQKRAEKEAGAMKRRLWISVVFLLPLMYVAMYHMYNEWFGIPIPGFVHKYLHGNENALTFALTQLLLLLPICYENRKFFSVGFKTLGHFSPNMDSLIALGASASIAYGIFAMYRISYGLGHGDMALVEQYSHDLYFESAGMILTLITVGKYLESRSKGKTSQAITKLMDLSPKSAILLTEDGREVEVPTEELRTGDIFLVKPGSLVPVDATVVEGSSSVDEAAITGESVPVEKHEGDKVVSATVNKAGFLKCRADRVGEDTTLSQIIRLVEEASASKAPIAQLADKVAGVFVPVVIGIAAVTLCVWMFAGAGLEFALSTAIAVLVISCPCALGLATPVAIMVGTGVGAGHGILIKSGEALQQAREVDTVVMDKTGTITAGRLKVMEVSVYARNMSADTMLQIAGALEKKSEHPLAEAVVGYADDCKLHIPEIRDFKAVFGRGVEGVLKEEIGPNFMVSGVRTSSGEANICGEDGSFATGDGPGSVALLEKGDEKERGYGKGVAAPDGEKAFQRKDLGARAGMRYFVGNLPYMEENGIFIDEMVLGGMEKFADEGMTPLLVAEEGRFLGVIGVADEVKATSLEAIRKFKEMGIHVVMLTGDNRRTAEAVRQQLEIEEVVAEVLPQDKEKKISQLQSAGHKVAMIGDGINDAPALAAADVGMAIGAGTDVAMESADIILMKSDLRDAVTAVRLSRAVIRNIKENLFWAFFYNAIGIPLAAGLWYPMFEVKLNPMFGAAAMSLSSIFVVGNALRLRGFRSGFRQRAGHMEAESTEAVGLAGERQPSEVPGEAEAVIGKASSEVPGEAEDTEEETPSEIMGAVGLMRAEETSEKIEKERKEISMEKLMTVNGMMCGHCTGRVQKALEALEGVKAVTMDLEAKTALVGMETEVTDEALTAAVAEAGYEVEKIVLK